MKCDAGREADGCRLCASARPSWIRSRQGARIGISRDTRPGQEIPMPDTSTARARVRLVVMLVAITTLSQFFRVSSGVIGPEVMRDLAMSAESLGYAGAAFFMM